MGSPLTTCALVPDQQPCVDEGYKNTLAIYWIGGRRSLQVGHWKIIAKHTIIWREKGGRSVF